MDDSTLATTAAQALTAHRTGRLTEAEGLYRKALATSPDDARALHRLGLLLREMGRDLEAVPLLCRSIELKPNVGGFHCNLAAVAGTLGDHRLAVEHLKRAAQIDPTIPEVHHNLSVALEHLGKLPEAEASHREALRLRPDYPEAHNHLGVVLRKLGRTSEAAECHKKAITLRPNYAEAYNNLAAALGEQGDQAGAVALIRSDRIDILVDLAGHWAENRMALMARKPAPVQVQIGYPGTTGPEAIDYHITDAWSDPPSESDVHYVERLVRLPRCAWCYEADDGSTVLTAGSPAVGPLLALSAGCVTQVVQEGTIADPDHDYFQPSICANQDGDAVLAFNRSGPGTDGQVNGFFSVGTPDGSGRIDFGPVQQDSFQTVSGYHAPGQLWGQYSSVSPDPTDPSRFWLTQEIPLSPNQWGTQITEVVVPEPESAMLVAFVLLLLRRRRR